jgi:hypothetical protein
MATLRGKIKNVLGLVSVGVLFGGAAFGILAKENNLKVGSSQSPGQGYLLENSSASAPQEEVLQPMLVCSEVLEKDENAFIFAAYNNVETVDCMSVGCGGIF